MQYSRCRRSELQRKVVCSNNAPAAIGPYSQAIVYGQLVFTSGQLGIDPANGKLKTGIEDQAKQAFQNLKSVLEESHSSLGAVLKTTVFLQDMKDFASVNEIYARFFSAPFPARSAVQISRLPMNGLIEIEAIAVVDERPES